MIYHFHNFHEFSGFLWSINKNSSSHNFAIIFCRDPHFSWYFFLLFIRKRALKKCRFFFVAEKYHSFFCCLCFEVNTKQWRKFLLLEKLCCSCDLEGSLGEVFKVKVKWIWMEAPGGWNFKSQMNFDGGAW